MGEAAGRIRAAVHDVQDPVQRSRHELTQDVHDRLAGAYDVAPARQPAAGKWGDVRG